MKRLSVVLLLLGLVGCNYPSRSQANEACYEWMSKQETFNYQIEKGPKGQFGTRFCREEEETKQILGYEAKVIEEDYEKMLREIDWTKTPKINNDRWKVVKHFRY